jgi:zinc/manganese transport system substrate-binding protein
MRIVFNEGMRIRGRSALKIGIVVLVAAAATACSSGSATSGSASRSRVVNVVAAENFWGDIAKQIGGTHVKVHSIISDPSADPHLYESNAADGAALANAHVVIQNGLGYDDFIGKLLSSTSNSDRKVLSVARVLGAHKNANPHLWYDIPQVGTVAAAIERELARADPKDAAAFAANLTTFNASLRPLLALITDIKTRFDHTPVAYTERVPQYLLVDANLDVRTPSGFSQAIEDGTEPSPGDTKAMNDLMSNRKVKVLLYNAQATSPVTQHVRSLARQAGIPVVGVTETLPAKERHYQSWQLHQLESLLRALGG